MLDGFDLESITPEMTLRLLTGVESPENSIFEEVFAPDSVELTSGTVPYIPEKHTLVASDDQTRNKIAMDAAPDVVDLDLGSVDFEFDGKFSKEGRIHKKDVRQMANKGLLDGAEDLVQWMGMRIDALVKASYDIHGAEILKDPSQHVQLSVNTAWDPSNDTDLFADMYQIEDELGTVGTVWFGKDYVRKARKLPELRAHFGRSIDADSDRVSESQFVEFVQDEIGADRVIINGTTWERTSNQAQTLVKERIFDGVAFACQPDEVLAIEFSDGDLDEAYSGYDRRGGQQYYTGRHLYRDISMGPKTCILQGI